MIFKTLLKKGIWDNINKNVYFQAQPQHVHILVTLIYYTALLLTCCRWLDNKLVRFPHNIGNTNTRKVFYYILQYLLESVFNQFLNCIVLNNEYCQFGQFDFKDIINRLVIFKLIINYVLVIHLTEYNLQKLHLAISSVSGHACVDFLLRCQNHCL